MKPFNLEEYLANPSRKVVTRDGREVKIHCTNYRTNQPIIAEIEGKNYSESFTKEGKWLFYEDSENDLFFAPEKHEGWVNIFKGEGFYNTGDTFVYNSKEEASKQGKDFSDYIATTKIEWEE